MELKKLMGKRLITVCGILIFALAAPASADPPPTRPDLYVKSLPKNQWVFAKTLWGERQPCTAESCMGGFYSPPLMLSVWFEKNSNDDKHSIEAVATIEGCEPLGTNLIWERDYESLKRSARAAYVKNRVESLVKKMAETCVTKLSEPVPLDALDRFFSADLLSTH